MSLLADDPRATDPYPTADLDPDAPDVHHLAADLPPVTLGLLWPVLAREVPHWQRGEGWNSLLRVGLATDGREQRALYVSQPRSFTVHLGGRMPPRVILDATANEPILRRLLHAAVHIERDEVTPPPHMRHVAVRTGKHYGITAMKTPDYRARAIKDVRHLLRDLDPDGALRAAGQVGLITFKASEPQVARALGIPPERSGHFWGIRGSNAFNDCALLLVLGTPMLNPEELFRMGCALYADARRPLVPDRVPGRDKKFRFVDRRLQDLSDVLTQAELTQCAHRNRPLRFDGRTVVTFCDVAIDFLPETQRVIAFPERLAEDGRTQQEADADADAQRLERAVDELVTRGERPTVARMEELLRRDGQPGIRTAVVGQFLRAWRGRGGPSTLGGPCAA